MTNMKPGAFCSFCGDRLQCGCLCLSGCTARARIVSEIRARDRAKTRELIESLPIADSIGTLYVRKDWAHELWGHRVYLYRIGKGFCRRRDNIPVDHENAVVWRASLERRLKAVCRDGEVVARVRKGRGWMAAVFSPVPTELLPERVTGVARETKETKR